MQWNRTFYLTEQTIKNNPISLDTSIDFGSNRIIVYYCTKTSIIKDFNGFRKSLIG